MKQLLLRKYPLLLMINLTLCYKIPPADFVIYPKGFSVSIPDEQGIEIFFFYGSVDKVTCNFQTNGIIMSTSKSNGEKWVLENTDTSLLPGQIIFYWLYVKKDGVGFTKHENFYNVSEIFSQVPPETTSQQPDIINLQVPAVVTTKTRLNLDPYHVKPSYSSISIAEKHPTGNLPFTPKPLLHLNSINPPTGIKPPLNFPFHYTTHSTPPKHHFSTSVPLNLDPISIKHPTLDSKNNFNASTSTAENNCTLLEGENHYDVPPLPLESNQEHSKENYDRCRLKHTSSKFNSNSPPISNHHSSHPKLSGPNEGQTSESTKLRPAGDIWYWT